jgi:hypothetical protein
LENAATVDSAMNHMLRQTGRGETATHGRKGCLLRGMAQTRKNPQGREKFSSEPISKEKSAQSC